MLTSRATNMFHAHRRLPTLTAAPYPKAQRAQIPPTNPSRRSVSSLHRDNDPNPATVQPCATCPSRAATTGLPRQSVPVTFVVAGRSIKPLDDTARHALRVAIESSPIWRDQSIIDVNVQVNQSRDLKERLEGFVVGTIILTVALTGVGLFVAGATLALST